MNKDQKIKILKEANAIILEAETMLSEIESNFGKILNITPADIKDFQRLKKIQGDKVIDICIGINWIIMPINQQSNFGDWK